MIRSSKQFIVIRDMQEAATKIGIDWKMIRELLLLQI